MEDVDDVIAMDAKWRDARWELDSVNAEFNKANKEVSKLKVAKENADEAIAKVKELAARRVELCDGLGQRQALLRRLHHSPRLESGRSLPARLARTFVVKVRLPALADHLRGKRSFVRFIMFSNFQL